MNGYDISISDVEVLRGVLKTLREFRDEWTTREDDPEEMWSEAPEMASYLVSKLEQVLSRIDAGPCHASGPTGPVILTCGLSCPCCKKPCSGKHKNKIHGVELDDHWSGPNGW